MKKISIVIAAYNHEKFVADTLRSILNQTYQNFEILITDDGSTDQTWQEIQKFKDPRIIAERLPKNMGACFAGQNSFGKASGEYICIISSDDCWVPHKLEKQVKFLDSHSEYHAIFSRASFIDDDGKPITAGINNVFDQDNKTREEWYRHFFYHGNCLCHPSLMIKKECYSEIGYYDNRLRQLPDFEMWVRFLKRYSFYIDSEPLVLFRIHGKGGNTSAPSEVNIRRIWNEIYLTSEFYFDNIELEFFYRAFAKDLRRPDLRSEAHAKIEQMFLFLGDHPWVHKMYGAIGLRMLYGLLGNSKTKKILKEDFCFQESDFHELNGKVLSFYTQDSLRGSSSRLVLQEAVFRIKNKLRQVIKKLI